MAQRTASISLGKTEVAHLLEAIDSHQESESKSLGRKNATLTKVQVKVAKAAAELEADAPEPEPDPVPEVSQKVTEGDLAG